MFAWHRHQPRPALENPQNHVESAASRSCLRGQVAGGPGWGTRSHPACKVEEMRRGCLRPLQPENELEQPLGNPVRISILETSSCCGQ